MINSVNNILDQANLHSVELNSTCKMESLNEEKIIKLENTTKYWQDYFKVFGRNEAVIFAMNFDSKLTKVEAKDTIGRLIELDLLENVKAVCLLQFKVFTYILFNNESSAIKFMENMENINGNKITFVTSDNKDSIELLINDMPPIEVSENIDIILKDTCDIIEIKPNIITLFANYKVETTPTKVYVKLKLGKSIEDIPQYIVKGKIKSLISIKGRNNPCYNCGGKDHRAKDCSYLYCPKCHMLSAPSHSCVDSYAGKLRKKVNSFEGMVKQQTSEIKSMLSLNIDNSLLKEDSIPHKIESVGVLTNDNQPQIVRNPIQEKVISLFDDFEFPLSPEVKGCDSIGSSNSSYLEDNKMDNENNGKRDINESSDDLEETNKAGEKRKRHRNKTKNNNGQIKMAKDE